MTRMMLKFSAAITLLGTSAYAGPPIDPAPVPAPAVGIDSYDCLINGTTERFSIDMSSGNVSVLSEGTYAIQQNGQSYVLDSTGIQVLSGPDTGKWDCSIVADTGSDNTVGDMVADAAELAALRLQVIELEASLLQATQEARLAVQEAEFTAAERDTALGTLAEVSSAQSVMAADLRVASAERATITAERDEAVAALAASGQAQIEMETQIAELEGQLSQHEQAASQSMAAQSAAEAALAEATAGLAASEELNRSLLAQVAELTERLELAMAEDEPVEEEAPNEEVAAEEDDMAEDLAPDEGEMDSETPAESDSDAADAMNEAPEFDADAALSVIEAADLSDIARAALVAAVAQAQRDPSMVDEVMARIAAATSM